MNDDDDDDNNKYMLYKAFECIGVWVGNMIFRADEPHTYSVKCQLILLCIYLVVEAALL